MNNLNTDASQGVDWKELAFSLLSANLAWRANDGGSGLDYEASRAEELSGRRQLTAREVVRSERAIRDAMTSEEAARYSPRPTADTIRSMLETPRTQAILALSDHLTGPTGLRAVPVPPASDRTVDCISPARADPDGRCTRCGNEFENPADHTHVCPLGFLTPTAQSKATVPYQWRVYDWVLACFGLEIAQDQLERCDRFIEEALEFVQAAHYDKARAHALVEYVFNRPAGALKQEAGGVMVTFAAACTAFDILMVNCGEAELDRVWGKMPQIRAKQLAKPKGSALPIPVEHSHGCEAPR